MRAGSVSLLELDKKYKPGIPRRGVYRVFRTGSSPGEWQHGEFWEFNQMKIRLRKIILSTNAAWIKLFNDSFAVRLPVPAVAESTYHFRSPKHLNHVYPLRH